MSQNPFLGHRSLLPRPLVRRGFTQHAVPVADDIEISLVRGPAAGPPLVLIPAQMGTWQTYERVAAALSRDYEVIAVDVPGHGASSWLEGGYTWDRVGDCLRELLERVLEAPAIVAGNSSGGILALWLAANAPEQVAAVVLEDAPVFSVEWPRFRDRDRFVHRGLAHAVEVLEKPDRRLADYFRGQELPVSPTRVKRFPDWAVDRIIDPGVRRWERRHPGEPSGFAAWWAPRAFGDLFRSLSMFDPEFARAFVDGSMGGGFSHEAALRAVRVPLLVMHGRWMRLEPYGLVGALDDADVARIEHLVPQARVVRVDANHVLHRYRSRWYVDQLRELGAELAAAR